MTTTTRGRTVAVRALLLAVALAAAPGCVRKGEANTLAPTRDFSAAHTASIEVRTMSAGGREAVLAEELRNLVLANEVFDGVAPPGQADVAIVATIVSLDLNNDAMMVLKQEAKTTVDVFMVDAKTKELLARFSVDADSTQSFLSASNVSINGVPLHSFDDKSKQALQNAAFVAAEHLKTLRGPRAPRRAPVNVAMNELGPRTTYVDAAPPPMSAEFDDMKGGLELGLRSGFGRPIGPIVGAASSSSQSGTSAGGASSSSGASGNTTSTSSSSSSNQALSDTVPGQIPLWLDVGYRVNEHIYVGLYGSLGFGLLPTNVCKGISCSAFDTRFGANAHYHFRPKTNLDPWLGLGIGYEALLVNQSASAGGEDVTINIQAKGFEFANLQAGLDYKLDRGLGIGPYLSASLGEYDTLSADGKLLGQNFSGSSSSFSKVLHSWVMVGVRIEYDIFLSGLGATSAPSNTAGPVYYAPMSGSAIASNDIAPSASDSPATNVATTGATTVAHGDPRAGAPAPATPAASAPSAASSPSPSSPSSSAPSAGSPAVASARASAWPASVAIADRTPCTFRCMEDNVAVDSEAFERAFSKQLGAMRACANQTEEHRVIATEASFGPDGRLEVGINASALRKSMQECLARIPPPANFKGPANRHWKCADYCQ